MGFYFNKRQGLTAILSREGEAGWSHLCTHPTPRLRMLVFPRKEPVHMAGTLVCVASAQEMPLDHLYLMASRTHRFHGTVASKEIVQN